MMLKNIIITPSLPFSGLFFPSQPAQYPPIDLDLFLLFQYSLHLPLHSYSALNQSAIHIDHGLLSLDNAMVLLGFLLDELEHLVEGTDRAGGDGLF